jgi:hypothetical protein
MCETSTIPYFTEDECNEIINKMRTYRENLIVLVAAFAFSIALEIDGSDNQSLLAYVCIGFVFGLLAYCAQEWKIDKNKLQDLETAAASEGLFNQEETERIQLAQRTLEAISPWKIKTLIQLFLLVIPLFYLVYLTTGSNLTN